VVDGFQGRRIEFHGLAWPVARGRGGARARASEKNPGQEAGEGGMEENHEGAPEIPGSKSVSICINIKFFQEAENLNLVGRFVNNIAFGFQPSAVPDLHV
jgi:hypothetical protein